MKAHNISKILILHPKLIIIKPPTSTLLITKTIISKLKIAPVKLLNHNLIPPFMVEMDKILTCYPLITSSSMAALK
jgi:hypothetical protein